MSPGIGALTLIAFLGAIQALVIGIAVLTLPGARTRLLGALLAIMGAAMAVIAASHTTWGAGLWWLYLVEAGLTIVVAPLFYLWVTMVMRGEKAPGRRAWTLAGAPVAWAVYVSARLLGGGAVDERTVAPIELLVAYQVFFTVLAAGRVFGEAPAAEATPGEARLARMTVGLFAAIHLAQLVRFSTDAPALRDVVPITATVVVLAFTVLAIRQSRLFGRVGAGRRRRAVGRDLHGDVADAALDRLRRAMEEDGLYMRPDLTLAAAARQIGLNRGELSRLVNERLGKGFLELLADYRVAEAERLLADPEWEHLTVEAVGGRAGFASRSAFYEAFKKATGETPAAYRKRASEAAPASPPRSAAPARPPADR